MEKTVSLKFLMEPMAGYLTSENMAKEIADFEDLHPNIKVELSLVPWAQGWKKIVSAAKARQLPDIVQIGNTWTKTLTAINALADISEEVSIERLKTKFYTAAWETCELQGLNKVYALPWSADDRMLFYRKDIFKKMGLTPRNLDTWQSFEEACKVLSGYKEGVAPMGVGDLKDAGLVHDAAPWVWSAGGDFLTEDGVKAAFQEEKSLKGIKFYFDLMQKGYAPITDRKVPGFPLNEFFKGEKYSMAIVSCAAATNFMPGFFGKPTSDKNLEIFDKFGVTFLPMGQGGRFTFLGGTNLAISNHSPYKREAWEFLKFLVSKEFQIRHYKTSGILPTGIEALNALFNEGTENEKVIIETYKSYGRSYKQVDLWGSIEFILAEYFGNIIDAVKNRTYNDELLIREANRYAEQVNYILLL